MQELNSINELKPYLEEIDRILQGSLFPKYVFSEHAKSFAFFDFSYIFTNSFYNSVIEICRRNGENAFVVVMTDPDPVKYFHRIFGSLPAIRVLPGDDFEELKNFVMRGPPSSPADAVQYQAEEIVILGEALTFVVYGHRQFDLGVIASGFRLT